MAVYEHVSVPGTPLGVQQAADAFEAFTVAAGVSAQVRWRFLVALDEILSNVVRHGLEGQDAPIDLAFSLDGDVIGVEVVDSGAPFDPLLQPAADTSAPLDERRPGGLGIALVRALMDEVRYERSGDRNRLAFRARTRQATASSG